MQTQEVLKRNSNGQFPKGVSGNPAGRPKGRKNEITSLKQDLEVAVREGIAPHQIKRIIDKMCILAVNGNVSAAKLILDKVVSNASESEDPKGSEEGVTLVIKNVTISKPEEETPPIDITPTEVIQDGCE